MSFTVPTAWDQLTQEQLRSVLRLLCLYGEHDGWEEKVQFNAFCFFCGIMCNKITPDGYMCEELSSGKAFIIEADLLPSALEHVAWLTQTENITVRIDRVGVYQAVDFKLQSLSFGGYLQLENLFQSFLQSRNKDCLVSMTMILYGIPEGGGTADIGEEVLMGVFLWFNAAKQILAREFPHFLKPVDGKEHPVTRESLAESMRVQLRLLSKGDVTKQKYILEETDVWTALAELDAQAWESEEMKKKYGK